MYSLLSKLLINKLIEIDSKILFGSNKYEILKSFTK